MAAMEKEMQEREKEAEKETKKRQATSSSNSSSPKKKIKMPGQVEPPRPHTQTCIKLPHCHRQKWNKSFRVTRACLRSNSASLTCSMFGHTCQRCMDLTLISTYNRVADWMMTQCRVHPSRLYLVCVPHPALLRCTLSYTCTHTHAA
jgi:hypothetical protein